MNNDSQKCKSEGKMLKARGRPVNEAKRAERAQQILAGARRCFISNGFHATTMHDISAEAGVSSASIYQYFPSKDALIIALIEQMLSLNLNIILSISEFGYSFENLTTIISPYFSECGIENAIIANEILAESSRNENIRKLAIINTARELNEMSKLLCDLQISGRISDEIAPEILANMIYCLFDSQYRRLAYSAESPGQILKQVVSNINWLLAPKPVV